MVVSGPGSEIWTLTLVEYAVPRTKLMKRAQNRGRDPTAHPRPQVCNINCTCCQSGRLWPKKFRIVII